MFYRQKATQNTLNAWQIQDQRPNDLHRLPKIGTNLLSPDARKTNEHGQFTNKHLKNTAQPTKKSFKTLKTTTTSSIHRINEMRSKDSHSQINQQIPHNLTAELRTKNGGLCIEP
jgi:hypothetical protein